MRHLARLQQALGERLPAILPARVRRAMVHGMWGRDRDRSDMIDVILHSIKDRAPRLDEMPFDRCPEGGIRFEHLAGLFASTTLDESIVMMNVRQVAYLFGLIRETRPSKVIEIGRHRGGGTLVIAAAMAGYGRFWSIDDPRAAPSRPGPPVAVQVESVCERLGLNVTLVDGDARTIDVDTGEVDLVFIDGDHTYEGARSDFERFGMRVRVGGAVLFDDAFEDGFYTPRHTQGVKRVVREIASRSDVRLVKAVQRLAHFERLR